MEASRHTEKGTSSHNLLPETMAPVGLLDGPALTHIGYAPCIFAYSTVPFCFWKMVNISFLLEFGFCL